MQAREGAVCQALLQLSWVEQSEWTVVLGSHGRPFLRLVQIVLDDTLAVCWHDQSYCCLFTTETVLQNRPTSAQIEFCMR